LVAKKKKEVAAGKRKKGVGGNEGREKGIQR